MKAPTAPPPFLSTATHSLLTLLRCVLALLLSLLLSPVVAPALVLHLPSCLPVRVLERVAVRLLNLVAALAAVDVQLSPRSALPPRPHLPAPLLRRWTSPLPRARSVTTYDQPGRWMSDAQLAQLRATLAQVARSSVGAVPAHRLFEEGRAVFENRVVSVARDDQGPLGFSAMAYLGVPGDVVVHLGLTMMAGRARGQRLQIALFTKCLAVPVVNLCRLSYRVTNLAASPAGIGNVSDYFLDCFPHYDGSVRSKEYHVGVARYVLGRYRGEFGCSERARFDARTFVVYGSNEREGGGTYQFIREDGSAVSRHRQERCNRFVSERVDFKKGDEIFQVATLDVVGSCVKYVMHAAKRKASK